MNSFAGFDTTDSLVGTGATIKAAGYGYAIKYALKSGNFPNKAWTKPELAEMHVHGIRCGVVFETSNTVDHFTAANGEADAVKICSVMKALGFPPGHDLAAWTAFDLDLLVAQIEGPVHDYAVPYRKVVENEGYLPGAYGNGDLLRLLGPNLGGAGLFHWLWLPQSTGWGGEKECLAAGNWHVQQLLNSPMKLSADGDTAKTLDWAY